MNKKTLYKALCILFLIIGLTIFLSKDLSKNISNTNDINKEKIYKVAFYNHPPFYYINEKSQPAGYYCEVMDLISKELDIKYEYVYFELSQCIDKLLKNEVDLVFGVSKNTNRKNEIVFSKYSVAKEDMSIYINKPVENEDLNELKGAKFGYLQQESNSELFLQILNKKNIHVKLVEYSSYESLKQGFINDEVDAILYLSLDKDLAKYSKIFNFSIGELYLAGSTKNSELINYIDIFLKNNNRNNSSIKILYQKYFNKNYNRNKNIIYFLLISIAIIIILIYIYAFIYWSKKNEINKLRNKICNNLKHNNYVLYYQPIVNPKNLKVQGFEGLIRLLDKDKIIPPNEFLKDIEETNMMNEVSLWILKKAISDYNLIKDFNCISDDEFYISINLSFKEIEDEKFIEDIKEILSNSKLKPNTICLEIVEKFAIKDLKKIQNSIYKLKESGFIVAIDDFGVEYSNLDILEKIDCDIVKLDKYFIDDIYDSLIRREVVHFISNICKITNKTVVCEGVENEYQKDVIKNMDNDKFYIQGYYYSKPLKIEDLKRFKVK